MANISICLKKLSSPILLKPVKDQKLWPPRELDQVFKDMISGYTNVLVDDLNTDEAIFALLEPTRLKPDAHTYLAKRERKSLLHWKEHTDKALKKLIREEVIKKALPGAIF